MPSSPTVTVIIPALNEARNLEIVLPRLPAGVDEVILVDGHSTDDTVAVARRVMPSIRIVPQQGKGKGAALRTGFAAAKGDIIVMLDADGSTAPEEIPAFVQKLTDGADFVKGSRFLAGGGTTDMSWYRRLGNWGFVMTTRVFFGGGYTDLCYGYNAFWRRVVPMLELDGNGFEIETMMNIRALRAGLRVAEVPSFEAPRIHGESNLRTFPDGWRVLKTIFREKFAATPLPMAPRGEEPLRSAVAMPIRPSTLVAVQVEDGGDPQQGGSHQQAAHQQPAHQGASHARYEASAAPSEIIAAR